MTLCKYIFSTGGGNKVEWMVGMENMVEKAVKSV